jgi:hypothetical protein
MLKWRSFVKKTPAALFYNKQTSSPNELLALYRSHQLKSVEHLVLSINFLFALEFLQLW